MAKKSFVNPFVIATAPGPIVVTPDVTSQASTDAVSYDAWAQWWDSAYDDYNENGICDLEDYVSWWYECMDAGDTGFTEAAYKALNGTDLPPRP